MQIAKLILKTMFTALLMQACPAMAQSVVLLSPAGDGGFENGTTLAANGWTVQNYTTNNTNKWFVGAVSTPAAGIRAAYISGDAAGTTYNYTVTARSKVMFWRNITFPAGHYSVQLSFKIKVTGQNTFDDLSVFFQSGNTAPTVATQPLNSGTAEPAIANATRIATLSEQGGTYVTKTYTLNAGNTTAATTRRLIFYWENDNLTGAQPPASIDDISVTACIPPELTRFADTFRCGPGSVTFRAAAPAGAAVNWYTAATGGTAVHTGTTYTTPALSATTNYFVTATNGGDCESARKLVKATIYPLPVVNLGSDIDICIDRPDSVLVTAGTLPAGTTCLWQDGYTTPSRYISQSGRYDITVTDAHMCKGRDTIQVTLRNNPSPYLGNDTSVCNGVSLVLDAGPGMTAYRWNTGATTQTITAQSPISYWVKVTNSEGCSKPDTIAITMNGELPYVADIIINNDNHNTYSFKVYDPRHVIGYDWDFGDNSPHSSDPAPSHTYTGNTTHEVLLRLQSDCGYKTYKRATNTVGIEETHNEDAAVTLFPNPARDKVIIVVPVGLKLEQVDIYDVAGKQLLHKDIAGNKTRHELNIDRLAGGTYFVKISHQKGYVYRKLQRL